jgi:hypothetical protein
MFIFEVGFFIKYIFKLNIMKKLHFIIFLFALNITAQEVYTYKSKGRIYQNGVKVNPEAIAARFENNADVLNLYKAGKTKQTLGNVLLWGGLALGIGNFIYVDTGNFSKSERINSGYFEGSYQVTSDFPSNTPFYISAAMIVTAIPVKIGFEKKIKKSVELMNETVKNPKTTFNIEATQIIANKNGIGLAITF